MSNENNDIKILLNKLEYSVAELKKLQGYSNNNDFNRKLDSYEDKFISVNEDLRTLKENILNTKEYLLLELESNLDKHNQVQIQQEKRFQDLVKILKNENYNKIVSLSEELGKTRYLLDEKNKSITALKDNEINLNNQINLLNGKINENNVVNDREIRKISEEKTAEIDVLNSKIVELEGIISENDRLSDEKVNELNLIMDREIRKISEEKTAEIDVLNSKIVELEGIISEKDNQIEALNDDYKITKLNLEEKDIQIKLLKEEIEILNSIIEEKNKSLIYINEGG